MDTRRQARWTKGTRGRKSPVAGADAKIGYIDEFLWEYRIHSPQSRASCLKYPDTIYLQTVVELAQYLMQHAVYRMTSVRRRALALEILKMARSIRRCGYAEEAENGYECARNLLKNKLIH